MNDGLRMTDDRGKMYTPDVEKLEVKNRRFCHKNDDQCPIWKMKK